MGEGESGRVKPTKDRTGQVLTPDHSDPLGVSARNDGEGLRGPFNSCHFYLRVGFQRVTRSPDSVWDPRTETWTDVRLGTGYVIPNPSSLPLRVPPRHERPGHPFDRPLWDRGPFGFTSPSSRNEDQKTGPPIRWGRDRTGLPPSRSGSRGSR